jgi:hypothetical protein
MIGLYTTVKNGKSFASVIKMNNYELHIWEEYEILKEEIEN